jgi:hypothetical protein
MQGELFRSGKLASRAGHPDGRGSSGEAREGVGGGVARLDREYILALWRIMRVWTSMRSLMSALSLALVAMKGRRATHVLLQVLRDVDAVRDVHEQHGLPHDEDLVQPRPGALQPANSVRQPAPPWRHERYEQISRSAWSRTHPAWSGCRDHPCACALATSFTSPAVEEEPPRTPCRARPPARRPPAPRRS